MISIIVPFVGDDNLKLSEIKALTWDPTAKSVSLFPSKPIISLVYCRIKIGICRCLTFLFPLNTMVSADCWTWTWQRGQSLVFFWVRRTRFQSWFCQLRARSGPHTNLFTSLEPVLFHHSVKGVDQINGFQTHFSCRSNPLLIFKWNFSCLVQVLQSPCPQRSRKDDSSFSPHSMDVPFPSCGPHRAGVRSCFVFSALHWFKRNI